MIPAAIIFIALRHYDMVNNNKYAIELLFIISIVTWYGLTLIWNYYIDPESYKKFKSDKIKIPSIKRGLLLLYTIQFYWIAYWINNWFLLLIIFLLILYYECHYSIFGDLKSDDIKKIDITNNDQIRAQILLINETPSFFTKLKRIHFDLHAVIPLCRLNFLFAPFRAVCYVIFFVHLMCYTLSPPFDYSTDSLPGPVRNINVLRYNYKDDLPTLENATLLKNIKFTIENSFGFRNMLTSSIVLDLPKGKLYYRPTIELQGKLNLRQLSNFKGIADVWIYSNSGFFYIAQLKTYDNDLINITYQELLNSWLKTRNLQRLIVLIAFLGFILSFVNDYFCYFYLRRFYDQ